MLSPEKIRLKRERAKAHMGKGDPVRAAGILRELADGGLTDPNFLCEYALALHAAPDFPATATCLERLLRIWRGHASAHRFAGDLFYRMRKPDEALRAYAGIAGADDADGVGRLAMARILERAGRRDEAGELVTSVLRGNPSSEEGRFQSAVLAAASGRTDESVATLRDLLAGAIRDRDVRREAGHALAAVLDKQGAYAEAFRTLLETKSYMESAYAGEIAHSRGLYATKAGAIRAQTASLTTERLRRWRAAAPAEPLRAAVLAGHPRSGTTLMESILDSHTGLVSVEETECLENQVFRAVFKGPARAELFDPGFLDRLPAATVDKAREGYRNAMAQFPAEPVGDRLMLDKNPMLTHFLGTVPRFFPEMKIIVAIRDPRDVCLSCFQQSVGVNHTNAPWLRLDDTMRSYNDVMGVWLRLRDLLPDGFLEVRYERLVEDAPGVARETLDFLGLPWEAGTMAYHGEGRKRMIFSPTYAQAAKPVYRSALRRWENYAEFMEPHRDILRPALATFGYL